MSATRVVCCVALISFIQGCNSVFVDAPLGDPLAPSDAAFLEGVWAVQDDHVAFLKPVSDSRLVLGLVDWNDGQQRFDVKSITGHIRRTGHRVLLFLPYESDSGSGFSFLWVIRDGANKLQVVGPIPGAFRTAVEQGRLNGEVRSQENDHFTVRLKADARLRDLLTSSEGDELFDRESASDLRRLGSLD